jgi:hypothetical protein
VAPPAVDVVKARMSVQRRGAVYRDTRHALTKILREEGMVRCAACLRPNPTHA